MNSLFNLLEKKNNGIKLSIFRILFGVVVFWEFGQLCLWNTVGDYKYINTVVHFKFPFFSWVKQAPDTVMYFIFWSGLFLSILFILGWFYRYVSILLFVIYTYIVLIDISYWNNHYYFFTLILFLFVFARANYQFSLDRKFKRTIHPPREWNLWIICFTIIIILFYGAVSKIHNPDWFSGLACYHLLSSRLSKADIVMSETSLVFFSQVMTWGGFFFDLLIGFILLRSSWFIPAAIVFFFFNITNVFLFNIGSFPFAMLGALVLFLPDHYLDRIKQKSISHEPYILSNWKRGLIGTYVVMQIVLPLRHFFIEGHVLWTGEGKLCSWHMMSAAVEVNANTFYLKVFDDNKNVLQQETINVDLYLNKTQKRTLGKFPFTIKQFSDFAKYELEAEGYTNFAIYPDVFVGRNGRMPKPIVGRNTNLNQVNYSPFTHNNWILLYADTE
jgi:uncharacterized membrane protein YphA (DoxX/SURF4 family)